VKAKKEGATLTGVEWQSAKYVDGLHDDLEPAGGSGLPLVYESTGTETRFTNLLDPDPASRPLVSFHRPETLIGWLDEIHRYPDTPTLRRRRTAFTPTTATISDSSSTQRSTSRPATSSCFRTVAKRS